MSRLKKVRRKQHAKAIRGMAIAFAVASDPKLNSDPKFKALNEEYFSALGDLLDSARFLLFGATAMKHHLNQQRGKK